MIFKLQKMKASLPVRIINFIGALLFFLFAWFQRNDIDPAVYYKPSTLDSALWFVFYLAIGVILIVVNWKKIPMWLFIIGVLACLVEMVVTGPGLYQNLFGDESFNMTQTSMTSEDPRVELSREFFGAVIALVGVTWGFLQHRKIR